MNMNPEIGYTQDEMLAEEQEHRELFGCEQHRQQGGEG